MRILLDECLPRRLKRDLPDRTFEQEQFDVFLTVERNLSFQQDIGQFQDRCRCNGYEAADAISVHGSVVA